MDKEKLKTAWQKVMTKYGNQAAVAIQFVDDDEVLATTNAPALRYETASTVKVAVLALLLKKTGGQLNPTQRELTERMIRYSDNDATTAILENYLGGMLSLQSLYQDLGMTNTTASSWWGTTLTVPSDQLKLLRMIYCNLPADYLSDSSRAYVKKLMGEVAVSQQWGISTGKSEYYLKNGWRPASDNGKWEVHSIGYVPNEPKSYIIAIYTRNNRDYASGVRLVEDLARATQNNI